MTRRREERIKFTSISPRFSFLLISIELVNIAVSRQSCHWWKKKKSEDEAEKSEKIYLCISQITGPSVQGESCVSVWVAFNSSSQVKYESITDCSAKTKRRINLKDSVIEKLILQHSIEQVSRREWEQTTKWFVSMCFIIHDTHNLVE